MGISETRKRKAQVSVSIDIDILEALQNESIVRNRPFSALLNEYLREKVRKIKEERK